MASRSNITILGKKIKIRRPRKLVDESGNELFGLFDRDKLTIYVSQSPHHDKDSTLLHECIHAIFFITGQTETLEHEQEEAIVRAMEHALAPLIRGRLSLS